LRFNFSVDQTGGPIVNRIFSLKKLGGMLAIGALSLVFGCESVALLPRDNIADRGSGDRRDEISRDRDRMAVERGSRRDEIFGTVQNVDERSREIRVRTNDGRSSIVRYDGSTRVSDGSRDLSPDSLRSGDEVSVRLGGDSRGEQYADSIRVLDKRGGSLR
jgi:hypothetical protein